LTNLEPNAQADVQEDGQWSCVPTKPNLTQLNAECFYQGFYNTNLDKQEQTQILHVEQLYTEQLSDLQINCPNLTK
jgi:hypothetical protein